MTYGGHMLCQKHYFRLRRNGTTEIVKAPRKVLSIVTPNGYVKVFDRDHPLAMSDGFVYQHRAVAFEAGIFDGACSVCKKPVTWKTLHVDHINFERCDNDISNLRIVCRGCNVKRPKCGHKKGLTIDGITMTAKDWANQPGAQVCYRQIRARVAAGQNHESAVFGKNKTHPK